MKTKSTLLLALLVLCTLSAMAQDAPKMPEVIPPNPEIAALGKFGDTPVGHFTGVPNISIPLVALPPDQTISLNYHASGIRVNEIAPRTGLGWSLSAGGNISRSVHGIPDDDPNGFLNPKFTVEDMLAMPYNYDGNLYTGPTQWEVLSEGAIHDFEADVFNYSFDGQSGKFFFDQSGTIIIHPRADLKIETIKAGTTIVQWVITTPDGTRYYFGRSKDGSRTAHNRTTSAGSNGKSIPDPAPAMTNYISAWQLMDIETVTNSVTSFHYSQVTTSYWNFVGQEKEIANGSVVSKDPLRENYSYTEDRSMRLDRISNAMGSIQFTYGLARQDLKNDFALTQVGLLDPSGKPVDTYSFDYGYFVSGNYNSPSSIGNYDQRRKRLYLKKIRQTQGAATNKEYSFDYHTNHILPDRFSYAQDFWGYYNGQSNSVFYPQTYWSTGPTSYSIPGANRLVREEYAKACTLKRITYPTGGATELIMESNTAGNLPFFGMVEMGSETLGGINTANSNASELEKIVTINDPQRYIGGLFWNVDMEPCTDRNSMDCPRAVLFKLIGGQYQMISSTTYLGKGTSVLLDPGGVGSVTYKIKLYNYSGSFSGTPRTDISSVITGHRLLSTADRSVPVGGLRIKSLVNTDRNGIKLLQKDYTYSRFDDPFVSSGAALNPPTFLMIKNPFCHPDYQFVQYSDVIKSGSIFPLTNGSSYTVGYTNVTELLDGGNGGKTTYTFSFVRDGEGLQSNVAYDNAYVSSPLQDFSHRRGALLEKKEYRRTPSNTYDLVRETLNTYNSYDEHILSKNLATTYGGCYGGFKPYYNLGERYFQTSQTVNEYYSGEILSQTTEYLRDVGYFGRTFPHTVITKDSKGQQQVQRTYFPDDVKDGNSLPNGSLDAISLQTIKLFQSNGSHYRIAVPLQVETLKNGALTSVRTLYGTFNGMHLPKEVKTLKGKASSTNGFKTRISYQQYDVYGNIMQVAENNGPPITYLWGHNGQYPVAKIENASLSEVSVAMGTPVNDLKRFDVSQMHKIDALRNTLPKAMVTTLVQIPLKGIQKVTDPKGVSIQYEYDPFNRLKTIKDGQGLIKTEYSYHYANQNN